MSETDCCANCKWNNYGNCDPKMPPHFRGDVAFQTSSSLYFRESLIKDDYFLCALHKRKTE